MKGAFLGVSKQARHCEEGRRPDAAISWPWQEAFWYRSKSALICFDRFAPRNDESFVIMEYFEAPTHA